VRADGKAYLRITDQCQERCSFCFFYDTPNVDNLVRHHDVAELVAALDPETIQQVVLTGGEPTLDPRLPHYLATLASRGFRSIILQTNGIKLGEPGMLEALLPFRERLGIGFALHSATERTNDALTHGPPGAFPRKLQAIRAALALGFRCKLTLVLSRTNLPELVAFMETCSELLGGSDAFVGLSLPAIEGRMRLFLDSYPRLAELAVALPPALRRARELDLLVAFCHQCQVPPCIIPDDAQHLESLWFTERPAMWDHDRAYGARCHGCAIREHCSGVWSRYAEHFGTGELVPLGAEEVDLSPRAAERP
jgi:MoaA/NifB/PqqE/SkfB family radical SAM enzyme